MNKKQLSRLFYLLQEIEELEERIYRVDNQSVGVSRLSGMPMNKHGISNPVEKRIILLNELKEILESKKTEAINERIIIEKYIYSIRDLEVQKIFRKRYIEFKKWDQVAKEMFMCVRTIHRKHSNLLKQEKEYEEYNN